MLIRASGTPDAAAVPVRAGRQLGLLGRLRRDHVGLIGAGIVAAMVLCAVLAPWLAPYDPAAIHDDAQLAPPSGRFPLGTDELGRDLLSRLIFGARVSLIVSLASMLSSGAAGVAVGLVSGYYGGWVDSLFMRGVDVLFAFPGLLLALAILAILGPDLQNLILALAIITLPTFARVARGSALTVKALGYVEAVRALGAKDGRILVKHVLPNIGAPVIVQFTVSLAFAILAETGLSFLGLGVRPPTPSWGAMLSRGKDYLELSPWPTVFPGVAIMLAVLGFNFLGDSLRDALDPRLAQTM